jgi:putative transposase
METYRIHEDASLYYLTFSVISWLPVFIAEAPCKIVTDSLNYCHREKGLRINAFVIMPTHMHLIAFDAEFNSGRLRDSISAMRSYTGHQLCSYVEKHCPPVFTQALRTTRRADRGRQFWQQGRHAEAIYSRRFWEQKFDYVHDNPRRKGLTWHATDWRFSSAAYWLLEPPGESEVLLSAVSW